MSLRWYRIPRMVVLKPTSSVLEGARAMEHNNIGAIVVQDERRVVGLVTDRDLTVRVLGRGLDPETTRLAEVMTSPVVALSPADSQSDAIKLMQQRNIRRIPLVDADRVVGIVTLDDLLLDEAAPLEEVAAVVEAQIGEGGPAASLRSPVARRRAARAQATYGRLLNQLRTNAQLETPEQAETALEIVLDSLIRRLTPQEAKDLIAQLPSLLQPKLRGLASGPDKQITRRTIEAELAEQLQMEPDRAAQVLDIAGASIALTVSPGEIQDVQSQLPEGLRGILSSAPFVAS